MKLKLPVLQWYTNNVCNLACDSCITFNNLPFKGHYRWADNEAHVREWSKLLEIEDMSLLGGEILSNPDAHDWVMGVRSYFPNIVDFKITTNGVLLNQFIQEAKEWVSKEIFIEVSCHDLEHYSIIFESLQEIYDNKINWVSDKVHYSHNERMSGVVNGKRICDITISDHFLPNSIKSIENNVLNFHNSDMYKANLACGARVCHYVVEGKIYKCPVTAIGNILIDQFNVDPQAEQLLKSYKPIFYTDTDLVKRISNLPTEILEQCKLCPQFEEKDRFNLKNYFKISPVSIKKLNVSRRS